MIGNQLGSMGVVFEHAGEVQVGTAEAKIHGGFVLALDKFRQVVPGAEPGENAIAFPAPGNDLLPREIRGEEPGAFLSIPFYAPVEPVIIPAECKQDSSLFGSHVELPAIAGTSSRVKRNS